MWWSTYTYWVFFAWRHLSLHSRWNMQMCTSGRKSCVIIAVSHGERSHLTRYFLTVVQGTHTFVTSSPKGLLRTIPFFIFFASLTPSGFPSDENRTWFLIISQTPPSLWLVVFLLPPSCVESSAVSVNPGLSCPAVCIPLLLGEHGKAPGPLCSHRREVNEWESKRERERERERERDRERDREGERKEVQLGCFMTVTAAWALHCTECYWVSVTHTRSHINKGEKRGKGRMTAGLSHLWLQMWMKKEETSVTTWVPPHRNFSSLGVSSSSPLTLERD